MIIVLALTENHIKSPIDIHFGRCDWYCIYNSENSEKKIIENLYRNENDQAGCKSAEMLLKEYNIQLAVAGRFGSKVVAFFKENHVQMVIIEEQKTMNEILKLLRK